MNIVSNYPQIPLSPVNPATQQVRQENMVREMVKQPAQAEPFPREPGLAKKEHELHRSQTKEPRQRLSHGAEPFQNLAEPRSQSQGETIDANAEGNNSQQQGEQQQDGSRQEASSQESQSPEQREESAEREQEAQQLIEDQTIIRELKSRDQEVRAHEQAHASVGGQYAGAPQYDYDTGPDHRKYAVSGEVRIDVTPIPGDPKATILKMRQVRAAALAPADPSPQDLKVAAEANRMIVEAQGKLSLGDEDDSRYRGGDRRLYGDEYAQHSGENSRNEIEGEGVYTEAVMAHRNGVIANAYQQSSRPTLSGTNLSA